MLIRLVEKALGTQFWSLYRQSCLNQTLIDTECQEIQHRKAHQLLTHAVQRVPFWRERLVASLPTWERQPDRNFARRFNELPITTKADLRNGFPERVTSDGVREQWRYGNSAGTVDRVTVVSDFRKRDYLRSINLRMVKAIVGRPFSARIVEIPPDACNVVCALRDEGPIDLWPFVLWAMKKGLLFKRETRSDLHGRIERSLIVRQDTLAPLAVKSFEDLVPQLDEQLNRMLTARPNILRGLPLFLLWLAERARQRSLTIPSLKAILPYGGLMSEAMASRVSEALGAPFYDYYGTSEVGAIALQHSGEIGMRVFHDLVLVEVVDDQNRALPPGQPGRILLTDFHNYAMPLIRYEVGDCGVWLSSDTNSNDPFELSRKARIQVLGRQTETTTLPSGRLVAARDIMNTTFSDSAVINACVERGKDDRFTLKYAGMENIGESTATSLEGLFELRNPLRVRRVSYLRPESSGKYRVFRPE
jgi:phenylacetate-CoA ligase